MTAIESDGQFTLMDHLLELRRRLIFMLLAWLACFFLCYGFAEDIYGFLVQPLAQRLPYGGPRVMIYTGLAETFFVYIKVSFLAGFMLAFPIVAFQVWNFIAPGLYEEERKAVWPFMVGSPFLFLLGAALAYYVVFPLAWDFFLSFETPHLADGVALQLMPKVNQYLSLVMKMIMAFGLCFQLPIVLVVLARFGMTSSEGLMKKRRHAVVIVLMVAAVLTPPDVISQILLALPVMALYELSIFLVRGVEKKQAAAE